MQGPVLPGEGSPLPLSSPLEITSTPSPFSAPTFKYTREDEANEVRLDPQSTLKPALQP